MLVRLKEKIKNNPPLKTFIHRLLVHPIKTRPRFWLRCCRFLYIKRGKGTVIYRNTRKDIVPFNDFYLGDHSVIESFSTLNNMVGEIRIGSRSRIGLGNTIIGPVHIGNDVNLAQGVVVSGLNHNYEDPCQTIISQGVVTSLITIEDDVWVGANAVLLFGVTIVTILSWLEEALSRHEFSSLQCRGRQSAKVIKYYDPQQNKWVKPKA